MKPWFYSSYFIYNDTMCIHKLHSFDIEKIQHYGNRFLYSLASSVWPPHRLPSLLFFNSNIIFMYSWLNEETTECKVVITFWLHKPCSSKTALKLIVTGMSACFCETKVCCCVEGWRLFSLHCKRFLKNGHPIDIVNIKQAQRLSMDY